MELASVPIKLKWLYHCFHQLMRVLCVCVFVFVRVERKAYFHIRCQKTKHKIHLKVYICMYICSALTGQGNPEACQRDLKFLVNPAYKVIRRGW